MTGKTAIISDCGKFRYRLGRRWANDGKTLAYVMLNPSTADADQDDATIRRCITFAKAHGYSALEVVNLFAYRATKPADLRKSGFLVGPANDMHIEMVAKTSDAVCVAWGANAVDLDRPSVVMPILFRVGIPIMCLALTKNGCPGHPLMLASTSMLTPFTTQAVDDAMHLAKK